MVVARELDERGAGNPRREIPSFLDLHAPITAAVEHERRHADRRQHVANVDLGVHPRQRHGGARARAHAQVGCPPLAERGIGGLRGRPHLDADGASPLGDHLVAERIALLARRAPRVVLVAQPPGVAADHHERLGLLRVRRREQAAQRAAFGDAQQDRALRSHRVHDRPHVVQPLLERGQLRDGDRIGQPRPPLVEQNQARHRRQASEEPGERRLAPEVLEMRDPTHDEDQIDRAGSHDLVGDVHVSAPRVADARDGRGWDRRRTRGRGRLLHDMTRRGVAARDRGHEPVPSAVRGFDESRRPRVIFERLADLANGDLEHRIADEHARPDGVEQLLLRDQPPGTLRQVLQEGESLWGQRHRDGAAVQVTAHRVEAVLAECQERFRFHTAEVLSPGKANCIAARPLTQSLPNTHVLITVFLQKIRMLSVEG